MNDCRWPIGDPQHADFHFCGAPRVAGRPYCQAHTQAAIQPSKPRYPQVTVAEALRRASRWPPLRAGTTHAFCARVTIPGFSPGCVVS